MKRHSACNLFCLAVFLFLLFCLPAGRVGAEETKPADLSATAKYVKDWAARESFPDSPLLAYQNAYCQLALEGKVSETDKEKMAAFLAGCQREDGGFTPNPDLKDGSNVIFTYFALATLDLIKAPSPIDREKALGFILSLVQKDGGIKAAARDKAANLGTTSYAIRSLALLKALDRIDKNQSIAYIVSHREDDKGFGVLPGKPSAPQSTFMAVESLKLLGGLTEAMRAGVVRFLKETPYSGLRKPENEALLSMDNLAFVLETAATLSAVRELDTAKIDQFITSLFIPENGGFGPSPGLGSTPSSTYDAVVSLVELGKLKDPYTIDR